MRTWTNTLAGQGSSPLKKPILEVRGVTKSFPGVKALKGVDLTVYPGEIHALVGENGAGKSTLMKILAGAYQPDGGEILLDGQPVHFHSPHQARAAGIGIIYQELTIAPNLTVAENVFLGSEERRLGFLTDRATMVRRAQEV
ncbi:MAG: ATP-binding cassette domain-containing protein, partial [Verrucomicrobiota bacterium]|nr:ATP-binding cassette domain-containing protein [Verrucomicrobiota bacterium]